jgi:uncharacterized protein (DUF58 family)
MSATGADAGEPRWRETRTSGRGYLLAVLAVLAFIAGLFVEQPLIFASVPVTLLLAFTALRSKDPRPNVRVERALERVQLREEDITRVRLRAENTGAGRLAMLQIRDGVDPELRGKGTRSGFSTSLKAGESKDFYYEVRANVFGIHTLGPISLRVQDSTGLLDCEGELASYSKLIVFPKTSERLGQLAIRPRRTKAWPGEIVSRKSGAGMDYNNIRRFAQGDPIKRINWKATARQAQEREELLVNDYAAEVGAEVLIVVDAGRATKTSSGRDAAGGQTVKAAIAIAERLLHERNRVGLVTTGANPSRVASGYGRRQFDKIALSLLGMEPGDSRIQWWVECSVHMFFPNIQQIVFVSSLADKNSRETAAELARDGGRDVMIVSPDPMSPFRSASGDSESGEDRMATRIAEMERAMYVDQLRGAGALVVDWDTTEPLEEVMEVHRAMISKHTAMAARHG